MREVLLKSKAKAAIRKVAFFIESKNTEGSSIKWSTDLLQFITDHAALNITYPLCKNSTLANRNLSCIIFNNKWAITFKATKNTFTVYQIILGSKLR